MHVGIANPRRRGKRSRHSRRLCNPHFFVSGERPIGGHVSYPTDSHTATRLGLHIYLPAQRILQRCRCGRVLSDKWAPSAQVCPLLRWCPIACPQGASGRHVTHTRTARGASNVSSRPLSPPRDRWTVTTWICDKHPAPSAWQCSVCWRSFWN